MSNRIPLIQKFISHFERRELRLVDTIRTHIPNEAELIKTLETVYNHIPDTFSQEDALSKQIKRIIVCLRVLKKFPPYKFIKDWEVNPSILVDIDSTLFNKEGDVCFDYDSFGTPNYEVIDIVNKLYDAGCIVKIFTGRMNSYILGGAKSKEKSVIKNALEKVGLKYNTILETLKPNAEAILDDLAINPLD